LISFFLLILRLSKRKFKITNYEKQDYSRSIILMFNVIANRLCNTKKTEPVAVVIDKEQIKQEIQAKENAFAEIYNSGVVKNIGYYADDAITFYQNMAPLKSREERIKFLETDVRSNTNKISFTTNEVFVSNDGEQVVEVGSYSVVDSTNTAIQYR
jgi:ketosteroid isomerase-like protein